MIPTRHTTINTDVFSSYWEDKNAYLPQLISSGLALTDANKMIPFYFEADHLGDAVAQEYLIEMGFAVGMGKLHQIIASYPNKVETYSEATQKFLQQIFHIPHWLNLELVEAGVRFCNRTSTSGLATLRNYSLMGGYESAAINKPLIFTEALKKGAAKRLSDTVVFWVNVTGKNQLQVKNKGFYSAVTTRLIHSYSRLMILKNPNWDSRAWGLPLNTWDMLATNLGFSIAFIAGLKKLNINPTQLEAAGTLHLWKYVGYLLGIPEHLLVDTEQQAADALFLWSKTQKGADADSIALAHALCQEPKTVTFTDSKLLKKFVYQSNLGYNQLLLGNQTCGKLQLPKSKAIKWIQFLSTTNKLNQKIAFLSPKIYEKMAIKGYKAQVAVCKLYQKGK